MPKFTKKQQISSLKEGDFVNDIFVVKIKKSMSQYSKGNSITLILSDSSGRSIDYKYWGGSDEQKVKEIYDKIKSDSVVLVIGRVSSYNNKPQISADESYVPRVLSPDEYELDFVLPAKRNVEEMYSELLSKISTIDNKALKQLLLDIFEKDVKEKFKKHPGAIQIHHNWAGGLLQHTLEVIEYCEASIRLNPELNRDLLLAGAMLHDVGKLEELETTSRIKASQKGQFVGHLALGFAFVSEQLKARGIDELLKDKLLHLMVSHHGKLEFGAPKEPMIPEAVALYYADELSSKLSEMLEFIGQSKETTDDDFGYHYKKGINIFLK